MPIKGTWFRPRDRTRTIFPPPPEIEISTPRAIIVTLPHPPLFSHDGCCLGVDVRPSSLLFWGPLASPPWGSCSRSSLTRSWCLVLPLTPHLLCTLLRTLRSRKASIFVHGLRYGVGLSVEVGLGLLGLYLWWGKPWLVKSRSGPGLVVVPKGLAMAVCRLWLAHSRSFLHPHPGSVRWHCTPPLAGNLLLTTPHWLAPLLLPTGWYPTATHRLAPYCSSSLAGIPSARWLCSPTSPLQSGDLPRLRLVVV